MQAAYGLYTHIRANRRRSVILLIWLFGFVYLLVYAGVLAGEALTTDASLEWLLRRAWLDFLAAWPWATGGTLLWVLIAYRFHQGLIDAVTGGHTVTRQEQPRLYNLLENLCISRGITMPKLKVVESSALNAFATGLNQGQYAISVTTGLLAHLNDAEIEAVLAHELTHIRNGDVRLMVIAVVIAGVIAFFAELIFRMLFHSGLGWRGRHSRGRDERRGSGGAAAALAIAVMLIALAWLLSIVVRLALSRTRELLADAGSVELTKNPDAMITALRKIEGRGEIPGATSAIMEMCVDNPREGFADLFATHPSIARRVEALVNFAGGHDPGPIDLLSAIPPAIDANATGDASADAEASAHPTRGPWGPALPRR
jgi:heat shock protein HtpX